MKEKINLPTKITISRIIFATLLLFSIIVIYIVDEFVPFVYKANIQISSNGAYINYIMIILFVVFLVGSITDYFDGHLARKYNLVTDLGKFLDPIADKMLVNGISIFLILGFPSLNNSLTFPFFCVAIMAIRDLIIDGLRQLGAVKNVVISANKIGKLKTVLQMVAISIIFLNGFPFSFFDFQWPMYLHISDFICYAATIVSIISCVLYLIQNKKVFGGNNNE